MILKTGRKLKKDLETDGMSPHAVGALDGKRIASSDSEYFKLQGLLLPGTFGFSRCRLQVPVGQHGCQWVII